MLHGDPRPGNSIRCSDGAFIAVDFEFAQPLPHGETHDEELRTILYDFADEVDDAAICRRQRVARLTSKRPWWNRRVEDEGAC